MFFSIFYYYSNSSHLILINGWTDLCYFLIYVKLKIVKIIFTLVQIKLVSVFSSPFWKREIESLPKWQKGDPQIRIFLPTFWMKMIKPPEDTPSNQVYFVTHPQWVAAPTLPTFINFSFSKPSYLLVTGYYCLHLISRLFVV